MLEQTGTAKKLTGQILENWLVSYADGHGGIQSLVKTSSTGTNPVIDVYTITYADQTTSTFSVTNGLKGDKGDQTYVWIKYASRYPQADSDMSDSPDDWIGLYSGTALTAPTHYTDYTWFNWRGATGDPAILSSDSVSYQASQNGTTVPTGTWVDTPPYVTPGTYLWTRVILAFNSGSPVTYYTVSRYGVDGHGSAGTSIPLPDSTSGAVGTSMSFSREDHQHPLPTASDIVLQNGHTVEADINQLRKPYINLELTNPNPEVLDSISGYTENGMVVLSVSYKAGLQNWATSITVPTLPNKCYPRQKMNGTPRYESTSDVRALFCSIDVDGKITAFLNAPALQYPITFTFVYPETV